MAVLPTWRCVWVVPWRRPSSDCEGRLRKALSVRGVAPRDVQGVVCGNRARRRWCARAAGSARIRTTMDRQPTKNCLWMYTPLIFGKQVRKGSFAQRATSGFGKRKRNRQAEASTDLEAFTLTRGSPYVTIGGSFGFFGNCTRTSRNSPSGLASASARARSSMAAVCSW